MPAAAFAPFLLAGSWGADTQAPVISIISGPDRTRMSRVSGRDATTFTFEANEAVQAYEVKLVPGEASPRSAGTVIESGGALTAGEDRIITITDDELVAAGGTEATLVIKVFGQDAVGNWSS